MNDLQTSFFIARKSITRGSKSTLVLLISVLALSFMEMMFISGVISGMHYSAIESAKKYLSSDLIIGPQEEPQSKEYIADQAKVRAQVETIPGVVATARHYLAAGSLAFDKERNGKFKTVSGAVVGIDPENEKRVLVVASQLIVAGKSLDSADTDQILIGSAAAGGYAAKAADDLGGVKVGDKVQLTYSNGTMRKYTVKGIYDDTMRSSQIFITAKEAESVLSVYDNASQIVVKTDPKVNSSAGYISKIKSIFPHLKVQSYDAYLGSLTSMLEAMNFISLILSVISVLVAAITIFVLIYVNAINKRQQIGILKAIGIKQKIIIDAYIIQAIFYTICGVAIGSWLVFGLLQPMLIIHPVPLVVNMVNLVLVYSSTKIIVSISAFFIAGYLAGRIPAWMVARQDILKAIWG
jgi:putative ABC transport system permease protein